MLHGSHLMMGVGFFLIFAPLLGFQVTAIGITVAAISSLVADIDHPKSFISHWTAFNQMISRGVSSVTTHRGFTHTIYGCVAWLLIVAVVLNYLGMSLWSPVLLGAFLGYISHLAADSLNPQGVHWLGKKGGVHISGPVDTGSVWEKFLIPLVFILMVINYFKLL